MGAVFFVSEARRRSGIMEWSMEDELGGWAEVNIDRLAARCLQRFR